MTGVARIRLKTTWNRPKRTDVSRDSLNARWTAGYGGLTDSKSV